MIRMVPGDIVMLDGEGTLNAAYGGLINEEVYDEKCLVNLGPYAPALVIAVIPAKPLINESGEVIDRYQVLVMGLKRFGLGWGWNNWFKKVFA